MKTMHTLSCRNKTFYRTCFIVGIAFWLISGSIIVWKMAFVPLETVATTQIMEINVETQHISTFFVNRTKSILNRPPKMHNPFGRKGTRQITNRSRKPGLSHRRTDDQEDKEWEHTFNNTWFIKDRMTMYETPMEIRNPSHLNFTILKQRYNAFISSLKPIKQDDINTNQTRCNHKGKVFAIGINKSGTTTIYNALKLLGYTHNGTFTHYFIKPSAFNPARYNVMDKLYPNSKFILMRRESTWTIVNSNMKYTSNYGGWNVCEFDAYRFRELPAPDFAHWLAMRYELHNQRVIDYFNKTNRLNKDLLVLDMESMLKDKTMGQQKTWQRLMDFLGCDDSDHFSEKTEFPHKNAGTLGELCTLLPRDYTLDWKTYFKHRIPILYQPEQSMRWSRVFGGFNKKRGRHPWRAPHSIMYPRIELKLLNESIEHLL
eukprot:53407_1